MTESLKGDLSCLVERRGTRGCLGLAPCVALLGTPFEESYAGTGSCSREGEQTHERTGNPALQRPVGEAEAAASTRDFRDVRGKGEVGSFCAALRVGAAAEEPQLKGRCLSRSKENVSRGQNYLNEVSCSVR